MSEKTLAQAFPEQQERVRELLAEYESLPGGVGAFGAVMLKNVLRKAEQAAMSGDVVQMLRSYEELKGCKLAPKAGRP